jgi:uncharacterized protein (TIGR02466 family)
MPQISPLFATPFAFSKHPNPQAMNAELRELFLQREKEGAKYANPNPYTQRNAELFESHFDLFKWPESCVQQLKSFCWSELMSLIAGINQYDRTMMDRFLIYSDAWFHITRRGGFFGIHNHPMASWSGVYCVAGGEHDPNAPSSGQLSFIHPNIMNTMYMDASVAQMAAPFTYASQNFQLEAGQLVFFPSWVLHEVKPFIGSGERITVAFNCWFSLKNT